MKLILFVDDVSNLLFFNCSPLCPVQFSSVAQSYPTLCDPMNRSTPGLPVHDQLPESTLTHESVMPSSHLMSPPSPPAPNPSHHQGSFLLGRLKWLLVLFFSPSVVSDSATPWTAAHQASLSFTISQSLVRLTSIESVMPSNHLILCHPLLLLPSIFPSIRVFSSELALLIRRSKDWSFSIIPSSVYSGLISFRSDWFDLLAVQGILKSLLQHCNWKTSIFSVPSFLFVPSLTSIHDYLRRTYMSDGWNHLEVSSLTCRVPVWDNCRLGSAGTIT